jgi:hypothetical protein
MPSTLLDAKRLARLNRLGLAVFVLLALSTAPFACAASSVDDAVARALSSPVRSMKFWHYDPKSSVESRVQPAPAELLDYLAATNIAQGFPGVPSAVQVAPDLKRDFDQAIKEMPEPVRRLVASRLIGVFLVKDLGSTGLTDSVEAFREAPTSGMVIIDVSVFSGRNANSWASWKEGSPFVANGTDLLQATIEDAARDDRVHAIQYILLHEFGHVVSIGRDVNPPWTRPPPSDHRLAGYPFAANSWRVSDDGRRYLSTFDPVLPMRADLHFYTGAKLDAARMPEVYRDLRQTSFPTLYAATNPGDDFAEAFANYTHVVLMQRPYVITIKKGDHVVETYTACWGESRCQKKREILAALLAQADK